MAFLKNTLEDPMSIKILVTEKNQRLHVPAVTISNDRERLTLNREAVHLLTTIGGDPLEFIQIMTDDEQPDLVWIKPCSPESPGSRKLDHPSASTRTCHIRTLLQEIDWKIPETVRFRISLNSELQAGEIDLRNRLESWPVDSRPQTQSKDSSISKK